MKDLNNAPTPLWKTIPGAATWSSVEPVTAGWSHDKKYKVTCNDESFWLLRLTPPSTREHKAMEYRWVKSLSSTALSRAIERVCQSPSLPKTILQKIPFVHLNQPVNFRATKDYIALFYPWISSAKELETLLPTLPDSQQYAIGIAAGIALQEIHSGSSLQLPKDLPPWDDYFSKKIQRNLNRYYSCQDSYACGTALIDYLETHQELLRHRPQSFQHGDYHVGNMLFTSENALAIIDWNRCSFGDPWEEFNRIPWNAECSSFFATGLVDGYFDGQVPPSFFPLLAVYIFSNQLNHLPWAYSFGAKEVEIAHQQTEAVYQWYSHISSGASMVPCWYQRPAFPENSL